MIPVSIVILSYNKADELLKNIPPLLSARDHPNEFEIIIVDNNSKDGAKEVLLGLQKKHPEIILVLNKDNKGVGGGRNSGWAVAQREFIVALDDDTSIDIDDIRKIPSLFEQYSEAGIIAFRVVHPITGDLQNPHGDTPCEVANHHGAGFALRKEIYEKIGGNADEVEYGADELEYAIRVHAQGWKILYIPELTVFHNTRQQVKPTEYYMAAGYLYGNVCWYYKYFPKWMASRNSRRYLIIAARYWLPSFGIRSFKSLITIYMKAKKEGILKHQSIPAKTVAFYDNPNLRPEFGNVPLYRKAFDRIRGKR